MSCDWLVADVTVAIIGQCYNSFKTNCYQEKSVTDGMLHTDLLKTPYSITSDIRLYIRRQKKWNFRPHKR